MYAYGFRTRHLDAEIAAQSRRLGIQIVDDLHVIRQETNGGQNEVADSGGV